MINWCLDISCMPICLVIDTEYYHPHRVHLERFFWSIIDTIVTSSMNIKAIIFRHLNNAVSMSTIQCQNRCCSINFERSTIHTKLCVGECYTVVCILALSLFVIGQWDSVFHVGYNDTSEWSMVSDDWNRASEKKTATTMEIRS